MRNLKNMVFGAAAGAALLATPAYAVGLGDLAKVILGGGSILKKADQKCGSSFGLAANESLAITLARAAAQKALPASQFQALDNAAESDAAKQAESSTFCGETKKKKTGMLGKIKKAGKAIAKGGIL